MLTELKRCNSIGSIDGLLFLISMIVGKDRISTTEIRNRCALENGITINAPGAVGFLEYLKLVKMNVSTVFSTEDLEAVALLSKDDIVDFITKRCMSQLVEDGIFDANTLAFDVEKGQLSIKRSAFPLPYAAIRNFLTVTGALGKEEHGEICVSDYFESDLVSRIKSRKKKLTLEQLVKQQEEQSKRGLEAEEFVLALERKRLPGMAGKIKRISDYDVAAGYDIVSYEDESSTSYDRFLEVKCYIGTPHFYWSENECDVAKYKGDKYILCLVDFNRINEPGYKPEYIANPAEAIFEDENWLMTTASYKVQKI